MSSIPSTADSLIDLAELVRQTQSGDDESAQMLYDRCRKPLLLVIRRVMSRPLRRLHDSDDFLCEAFADVCSRHFNEEVLQSPESLWRYLKAIARNKVLDAHRKCLICQRSNILNDLSLDDPDVQVQLVAQDMSPHDVLFFKEFIEEWWEQLVRKEPLVMQHIVRSWATGESAANISVQLRVSVSQVYRVIRRTKERLSLSIR